MRTQFWLVAAALAAGLAAAPSQATSQSQDNPPQDSLAEAARKAREAKKAQPKPAKVFTNDDLAKKGALPAAGGTPDDAQGQPQDKDKAPGKDKEGAAPANGESYWRGRFKEAHENLARAEKELDILERELQKANTQYYSDPTKAMNEQFNRKEINDKTAAIEAKKKDIADLRQSISDMEDGLRKAGGDPGWAR
jgi:hypothetical protein